MIYLFGVVRGTCIDWAIYVIDDSTIDWPLIKLRKKKKQIVIRIDFKFQPMILYYHLIFVYAIDVQAVSNTGQLSVQ